MRYLTVLKDLIANKLAIMVLNPGGWHHPPGSSPSWGCSEGRPGILKCTVLFFFTILYCIYCTELYYTVPCYGTALAVWSHGYHHYNSWWISRAWCWQHPRHQDLDSTCLQARGRRQLHEPWWWYDLGFFMYWLFLSNWI